MSTALEFIKNDKIIAIARNVPPENITALAEALIEGGLHCIEVTFNHANRETELMTPYAISLLKERFGNEMAVGAGTVLSIDDVTMAAEAGAQYIISPDTNEDVIQKTKSLGLLSIPGAFTATEVVRAYSYGADFVKLFPAANLGVSYIKALRGPLAHIPMMAVGGVNPQNVADFLAAGCVGAGCGGGLVSLDSIRKGDFAAITAVARAYSEAIAKSVQ